MVTIPEYDEECNCEVCTEERELVAKRATSQYENHCKHLQGELDAYGIWYLFCESGETANENKCQKGLQNCDFFEVWKP